MRGKVSDHTVRDSILELVGAEPGIHLRGVAKRLNIHVNLADYHLRVLEKGGRVMVVEKGGRKGYFPASEGEGKVPLTQRDRRVLLLLREAKTLLLVLFLIVTGGARSGEVAKELGISPSTASHHLKRLVRDGVVSKSDDGLFVVNEPEAVARLVIEHRPGSGDVVDSFESLWEELSRHSG